MTKKKLTLTLGLLIVIISFILLAVFIVNITSRVGNDSSDLVSFPTQITHTSKPVAIKSVNKYISNDNSYEYIYPLNWGYRNGREGVGLYPLDDTNYSNGNKEILTIFSAPSNGQTPEEWSKGYDGYGEGYVNQRNIKINGYDAYSMVYETSYRQVFYIIKNKELIIHITFRQKDNGSIENIDNSKYLSEVEEIVNSITFLE